MAYPNITNYIEIVEHSVCFSTLHVTPVRDVDGLPVFMTGNMSIIFKVQHDDGRMYALKCYTRPQDKLEENFDAITRYFAQNNIKYIVQYRYLPQEITLFDLDDNAIKYPVSISQWIDGTSFKTVIKQLCYLNKKDEILSFLNKFLDMSIYLLNSEFSHGDIKPNNIIIDNESNLNIIDIDSMFCPLTTETTTTNFGTPQYQHPLRDNTLFNRHADDYSLLIIAVSLLSLYISPQFYDTFNDDERLIFSPDEIFKESSAAYNMLIRKYSDNLILMRGLNMLLSPTPYIKGLKEYLCLLKYSINKNNINIDVDKELRLYISPDHKYGFMSAEEIVIDAVFDDACDFREDFAAVCIDNKWGYINREGFIALPFCFDKVVDYNKSVAIIKKGADWQLIDTSQKVIATLRADSMSSFGCGMSRIKRGNKYGFINMKGDIVIAIKFHKAKNFRNNMAIVSPSDGLWGIININGKYIVKPIYRSITMVGNDTFCLEKSDDISYLTIKPDNNTE